MRTTLTAAALGALTLTLGQAARADGWVPVMGHAHAHGAGGCATCGGGHGAAGVWEDESPLYGPRAWWVLQHTQCKEPCFTSRHHRQGTEVVEFPPLPYSPLVTGRYPGMTGPAMPHGAAAAPAPAAPAGPASTAAPAPPAAPAGSGAGATGAATPPTIPSGGPAPGARPSPFELPPRPNTPPAGGPARPALPELPPADQPVLPPR